MKFITTVSIISILILMTSFNLSKKSFMDKEKTTPFECGFDPFTLTRSPFSLRFFKISIIFLIFDIEIVLILPFPLTKYINSTQFLSSSLLIMLAIIMSLIYEWNQGLLDWIK